VRNGDTGRDAENLHPNVKGYLPPADLQHRLVALDEALFGLEEQ
jgi:hypothetical protein